MDYQKLVYAILAMAAVMYLMRMLPLVFCKGEIKNKYLKSFLSYVPYAVLTSMTVPEAFTSTASPISASLGLLTAVILAYFNRGLLMVSISATAMVFITEQIMHIMGM